MGADTVSIVGYMTHICCDTTARQAFHRGFSRISRNATGTLAIENTAGKVTAEQMQQSILVAQQIFCVRMITAADLAQHEFGRLKIVILSFLSETTELPGRFGFGRLRKMTAPTQPFVSRCDQVRAFQTICRYTDIMKWIANRIMTRRRQGFYDRLREHLPFEGTIADIGSGTGHNAESIRRHTNRTVVEFDVANLRWAGPVAQRILQPDGRIPAEDAAFGGPSVLFVLHYPCDPLAVLHEIRRITTDSVLVIQSTYNGALSQLALKFREFFLGRLVLSCPICGPRIERGMSTCPAPLLTIEELLTLFASAGFHVCRMQSEESPIFAVAVHCLS